jgi:hypothetical protein
MRRFIPWICLLAVFAPLTVTSTPPTMLLSSYRISGTLLKPGGAPYAGARVALAARCTAGYVVFDGTDNGCTCYQAKRPGKPSAVTSKDGAFSLDLVSCETFDSLAVAVLSPDSLVTDHVVAVSNSHEEAWTEQVPSEDKSYFFCATSTGYTTVRIGVIYSFSSQTVTTP